MHDRLERDGVALSPRLLSPGEIAIIEQLAGPPQGAGRRICANSELDRWLRTGPVAQALRAAVGPSLRPVRAILFDKNPDANWGVGWHQDRTIAVRARVDLPGFSSWTTKSGITHVEPPFSVIEGMLTARIHLDPVVGENAPLLVAPGSHREGRIEEPGIRAVVQRCGRVACLAEPGDVWLQRSAILHASEKSRGCRSRRVLQVDFSNRELPRPLEWLGVG
ncbi:phytanoyl-CoA dioxygenase PhyH [Sphingomonas sp. F9_3S_D5_B_2]